MTPEQGERTSLRSGSLSLIEVIALSVSIIAPTMAMSLNTPLVAGASSGAVALTFLIATAAMVLVGFSFVEFSRRLPSAGSAFTYVSHGLGASTGFVAGWALLLTYWCYAAGTAAAFGSFFAIFLQHFDLSVPWWIWTSCALVGIWAMGITNVRLSTRTALLIEAISMAIILALVAVILMRGGASGYTAAPFLPQATGFSGIGFGIVYCILSFAGFEGAATLGEEAAHPHRAVPWAVLGTVIIAGVFYVLVGFAQTIGFGMNGIASFAKDAAPLDTLAQRFVGGPMGAIVDLGAAISAFACALGSATAGSRMLFALSREHLLPFRLAQVSAGRGTPAAAFTAVAATALMADLVWSRAGALNVYSYWGTLGTLTLIVTYLLVNLAAIRFFAKDHTSWLIGRHLIIPAAGILILLWPLYNSVWPLQEGVLGILPFVAVAWLVAGAVRILLIPRSLRAQMGRTAVLSAAEGGEDA